MAFHKLRKRYGRAIQAKPIQLHRLAGVHFRRLERRGTERDIIDSRIIHSIKEHARVKKPLDYISIIAHCVKEAGSLDPADLKPYSLAIKRLGKKRLLSPSSEKMEKALTGINPTLFHSMVKYDLLHGINNYLKKRKTPATVPQIMRALRLEDKRTLRNFTQYALGVLDVLSEVNKLPKNSLEGKSRRHSYIHTSRAMPLPKRNLNYAAMRTLRTGPKTVLECVNAPELSEFGVAKGEPGPLNTSTRLSGMKHSLSGLIDEGLVWFKSVPHAETHLPRFIYSLTTTGKRMLDNAESTGELTEGFCQKLLGTKNYNMLATEKAQLKKIVRWAKIVKKAEEVQQPSKNKIKRRKGTGADAIAGMLKENRNYVESVLLKDTMPQTLNISGSRRLWRYIRNIADPEIKAWLTTRLKEMGKI